MVLGRNLTTQPTGEPHKHWLCGLLERRAGEGTRTLDINLGKVALYQLSYTRRVERKLVMGLACVKMVFLLTVVLGARRGWEYWD